MDRPECADKAPDLAGGTDLLKRLLAIELARLDTAVKIEKERSIVFPETSVIIRDIQKLEAEIKDRSSSKTLKSQPTSPPQNPAYPYRPRSNVYDYTDSQ